MFKNKMPMIFNLYVFFEADLVVLPGAAIYFPLTGIDKRKIR